MECTVLRRKGYHSYIFLENCFSLSAVRETQKNTALRFLLNPVRMAMI